MHQLCTQCNHSLEDKDSENTRGCNDVCGCLVRAPERITCVPASGYCPFGQVSWGRYLNACILYL